VLLLFLAVRRPWGEWPALVGAALLAFSRSEVSEGHFITPDVLVVSTFLALLLTARARPGSVWTGVWAGVATAIKYSGVLLFAAVAGEMLAERRFRRLVYALACAGAAFAAAAPFALLMRHDQKRGVGEFATYYFGPLLSGRFLHTAPRQLAEVAGWIWVNLGPVAAVCVFVCVLARPRRPLVAPAAVLAASLAILCFAGQVYPRHILLASAAATILAAAGFAALRQRLPVAAAVALAAAMVAVPGARGVAVARGYLRATELDRAATWIEARGRPQRVATSLKRLRLDGPQEVRVSVPLWAWPAEPLAHYDLLVAPQDVAQRLLGLHVLQTFEAPGNPGGAIVVLQGSRGAEAPWPAPAASRATAPGSERAFDGDPQTAWAGSEGAGWIEAEWAAPRPLHAVEVIVPEGDGYWPQRLRIRARTADAQWLVVDGIAIRPQRTALQQPPHGQLWVLAQPLTADAVRIERGTGPAWALAEVRLFSPAEAAR
jgi:hypothetical protein